MQVQQQAEQRSGEALEAKLRSARLLEERRAARHAREAATDAERLRAWRATRLAAAARAASALSAAVAEARARREARAQAKATQPLAQAAVVIQTCWRVRRVLCLHTGRMVVCLYRGRWRGKRGVDETRRGEAGKAAGISVDTGPGVAGWRVAINGSQSRVAAPLAPAAGAPPKAKVPAGAPGCNHNSAGLPPVSAVPGAPAPMAAYA
jgi:hypothetical protein